MLGPRGEKFWQNVSRDRRLRWVVKWMRLLMGVGVGVVVERVGAQSVIACATAGGVRVVSRRRAKQCSWKHS